MAGFLCRLSRPKPKARASPAVALTPEAIDSRGARDVAAGPVSARRQDRRGARPEPASARRRDDRRATARSTPATLPISPPWSSAGANRPRAICHFQARASCRPARRGRRHRGRGQGAAASSPCFRPATDRLRIEEVQLFASPGSRRGRGRRADRCLCRPARLERRERSRARKADVAPVALGGDFQRLSGGSAAPGSRSSAYAAASSIRPPAARPPTLSPPPRFSPPSATFRERRSTISSRAGRHLAWKRRETYRAFNRRLDRQSAGCGALAGLYALDPALIGRFFGERLGLLDRRKMLAAAAR